MKTAGGENQERCANGAASQAHGTVGMNNPAKRGGLDAKNNPAEKEVFSP
jgi:hypothetical protein